MAPVTYMSRTYSRKSASKRKRDAGRASDVEDASSVASGSRKRIKSNRDEQETFTDSGDPHPSPPPNKPKVSRTYGSPSKRRLDSPSLPLSSSSKPAVLARDLSEVFESVTPTESPVGTPKKLARRMLTRSKTESSLETSPSRSSALERTPSLPTLPSTPSKDKGKRKEAEAADSPLNPLLPLPRLPSNVKKTYAGTSRSFLITIPASSLGSNPALLPPGLNVSIGDEEDDYLSRESYSSLRARWGVDNSEDDPYPTDQRGSPSKRRSGSATGTPSGSPTRAGKGGKKMHPPSIPLPPGMMNPLKSITELRSKGENRRFLDEIGYMFEGMDKSGAAGVKRTSALDIVTKLCDAEFARKAKAADFLGRIWDVFVDAGAGQNEDKTLDLLLAFLAALIARDSTSLSDLAQRPAGSKQCTSFVDTLFVILASCTNSSTADLLQLVQAEGGDVKRAGMTRKDQSQLTAIYEVIASKSHLFSRKTPITTPLLIIYTLQRLPCSLIHGRHVSILLASLRVSLSPLVLPQHQILLRKPSSRSTSKSISTASSPIVSHLEWRDAIPRISFECIKGHLQLLDAFFLGQWQMLDGEDIPDEERKSNDTNDILNQAKGEWLVEALIALAICAEMQMRMRDRSLNTVGECLDLVLRILVSQTHSDEGWSKAVLRYSCSSTFIVRLIAWAGNMYLSLRESEAGGSKHRDADVKAESGEVVPATDDEENDDGVTPAVRRGDDHEEIRWQDRLCLALGLLANLVQAVGEAKDIVRETHVDPNCPLKKSNCIHRCSCSRTISGLDVLVRSYSQQDDPMGSTPPTTRLTLMDRKAVHVDDDKQTRRMLDSLSLLGHLAVLFGLLMRESRKNEEMIVASLPGKGRRAKLSRLVEQARALVSFDAALTSANESGEAEQQGDSIARDVVMYLKELRDTAGGV